MPSIFSKLTTNINMIHLSRPATAFLAITTPPLLYFLASLPSILTSYRTYLAIGPGGLPHNFFGFLLQACLRVVARSDVRAVPPPYYHHHSDNSKSKSNSQNADEAEDDASGPDPAVVKNYAPHGQTSFLSPEKGGASSASDGEGGGGAAGGTATAGGGLPVRRGGRPTVPPFVAPQRQTSGQSSREMISRMERFIQHLVGANEGVLEMRPSALEGAWHDAVFLRARADDDSHSEGASKGVEVQVPGYMGRAKGEIVHVHSEGSSHVTVSLVDGEEAVGKGW
jgi:hypothetical protein